MKRLLFVLLLVGLLFGFLELISAFPALGALLLVGLALAAVGIERYTKR